MLNRCVGCPTSLVAWLAPLLITPFIQNALARREGRLAPVAKRELADFKREDCHAAGDVRAVGKEEAGG